MNQSEIKNIIEQLSNYITVKQSESESDDSFTVYGEVQNYEVELHFYNSSIDGIFYTLYVGYPNESLRADHYRIMLEHFALENVWGALSLVLSAVNSDNRDNNDLNKLKDLAESITKTLTWGEIYFNREFWPQYRVCYSWIGEHSQEAYLYAGTKFAHNKEEGDLNLAAQKSDSFGFYYYEHTRKSRFHMGVDDLNSVSDLQKVVEFAMRVLSSND